MSEQRVPYQAGEPAAETPLGQVAYEEQLRFGSDMQLTWQERSDEAHVIYEAMAAAVEAEVLRRAVAYLEAQVSEVKEECGLDYSLGYRGAIRDLEGYARQQGEG